MVEVVYIGLVVEEADMTKAVKVVTHQNHSHRHGIRRTNANGFGFLSLLLSPVLCRLQPGRRMFSQDLRGVAHHRGLKGYIGPYRQSKGFRR